MLSAVFDGSRCSDFEVRNWADDRKQAYQAIQRSSADEVRSLLEALYPGRGAELEAATGRVGAIAAGASTAEAAALGLRSVLERVKGDLFEKARRWPREDMKWETMAERLVRPEAGPLGARRLQEQRVVRAKIVSRLSDIAKGRTASCSLDVEDIMATALDHLLATLHLIAM